MSKTKQKEKKKSMSNNVRDFIAIFAFLELLSGLFIGVFPFISAVLTFLALTGLTDVTLEFIIIYGVLIVAFITAFLIPIIIRRLRKTGDK